MKVLHIITGLNNGGAEAVLFRLCKYDTQCQHHVVSMMDKGKYGDRLLELGVEVTCLDLPRGRIDLSRLWFLRRIIKSYAPDVVQTWMYHADLFGGIAARLAGVGNICWGVRNTSLDRSTTSRSTIIVAKLCAAISKFLPRRIICAAEASRIAHEKIGYDSHRMRVVNNGFDFALFSPDNKARQRIRASIGIGDQDELIGFVARYDIIKGHVDLLEALSVLRTRGLRPKCLLVGTGLDPDNSDFQQKILQRQLEDQVILFGPSTDIPGIMNALDVHVMPSLSEGFPNVLAEAMSCGTPCITTDVGDAAVIVGELGLVVPVGHPQALADAILRFLSEKGSPAWESRRENCREFIMSRFSINGMIAGFVDVWKAGAKSKIPTSGTGNP